jgi:hypothetical protein
MDMEEGFNSMIEDLYAHKRVAMDLEEEAMAKINVQTSKENSRRQMVTYSS